MRNIILLVILLTLIGAGVAYRVTLPKKQPTALPTPNIVEKKSIRDPLQIEQMRKRDYPASPITIEQNLPNGSNYKQYIASYMSEGLKIYALFTIPNGDPSASSGQRKPKNGWPVIIFNHGYIPANIYKTTERYEKYVDAFATSGYIVFKPDYRGNGNSQGSPEGAYYSPAYIVDDLIAIASMQKYPDANPEKLGVWGHSLGGNITLRDMVIKPNSIKAAVIWGGVVGSYENLFSWHDPFYTPSQTEQVVRSRKREQYQKKYGTPVQNPEFWHSIDPTFFVSDIKTPLQLHAGEADEEVPASFSATLADKLKKSGKTVELYIYSGADHNISQSFALAMQRSIAFFDKYLK
jgi:dipeptidyl aminopeptidase/acylaminoacyl peptidase